MGHGTKALTLAALMVGNSMTADAAAWRVTGFHEFGFEPYYADTGEPLGFLGLARLEYSAVVTSKELRLAGTGEYEVYVLVGERVKGWDSVNGGPWLPMGQTLHIWLFAGENPPHPDFLMPFGGGNWTGIGQFSFASHFDRTATFDFGGTSWTCYTDAYHGCGEDSAGRWVEFGYWRDSAGTVEQVPEPGLLALIGLGLAGLGASRRRRAN